MQNRTRTGSFGYAVLVIVLACVIVVSSGAMGGHFRSLDSGYPRELINQPACWSAGNYDDISRCEHND